ncbi:hypothetical protein Btru_020695 [Bulinus truncatus]|nr:hypothetical protein Btru_020695 [Bulinus truncatus]
MKGVTINVECKYFLHTSSSNITLADVKSKQPIAAPVSRIGLVAKLFDYSENEIPGLLAKNKFLNHLSVQLMKEKVKVMEGYELPKSFIKSNLRIMYHTSTYELQKRLELLKNSKFLRPNPVLTIDKLGHYLECPNEVFHLAFLKLSAELQSLEGCSNQAEYIMKRLNVTKHMAHLLVSSYPLNRGVSNAKLKEFFDFVLMEANLRPECVLQNMRLCSFSVSRLRERMNVMKAANVTPDKWIKIWNLSENEFKEQFESFIV